jgi:DNA-binding winged helix-turn-helix (wHTH) protein
MSNADNNLLKFDNFKLDSEKKVLWFEDSPCEVPIKAIELLCVLIESKGEIVSKNELLKSVWQDSFVEESVLPQNVYFLRKLFKKHGIEENFIQTVPRRGYRFAGELSNDFEEETVFERE